MYFNNPRTLQELKEQYKNLIKKHHPDIGGTNEAMKTINLEYEELFKILQLTGNKYEQTENINTYKDIINKIIHLNVNIEICGTWIWVTGDTRPIKEDLKQVGFQWARKKMAWYWRPAGYKKRSRRTWEMNKIRETFGSQKIKNQEELLQLA